MTVQVAVRFPWGRTGAQTSAISAFLTPGLIKIERQDGNARSRARVWSVSAPCMILMCLSRSKPHACSNPSCLLPGSRSVIWSANFMERLTGDVLIGPPAPKSVQPGLRLSLVHQWLSPAYLTSTCKPAASGQGPKLVKLVVPSQWFAPHQTGL